MKRKRSSIILVLVAIVILLTSARPASAAPVQPPVSETIVCAFTRADPGYGFAWRDGEVQPYDLAFIRGTIVSTGRTRFANGVVYYEFAAYGGKAWLMPEWYPNQCGISGLAMDL